MAGLCVLVGGNPTISSAKDALEVGLASFLGDFGQNCSVFDTVSNTLGGTLQEAGKLKQELEDTLKAVSNAAYAVLVQVEQIIKDFPALLEEGIELIAKALDDATGIITALKNAIEDMTDALKTAVDSTMSALCNTLSSTIMDAPASVKSLNASTTILGPSIDFAKKQLEAKKDAALKKISPADLLHGAMEELGVRDIMKTANNLNFQLNQITDLTKIKQYVCSL